jgi:hypothetical protein
MLSAVQDIFNAVAGILFATPFYATFLPCKRLYMQTSQDEKIGKYKTARNSHYLPEMRTQ